MNYFSDQFKTTLYTLPSIAAGLVLLTNAIPFWFGGGTPAILFFSIPTSLAIAWAGGHAGCALRKGGGGVGDELRRVKNCQQILYLTAGVGAAMLSVGFSSSDGDTACLTVVHVTQCRTAADSSATTCLAIMGLLYLVGGAFAVVLEPRRHTLESKAENALVRPAGSLRKICTAQAIYRPASRHLPHWPRNGRTRLPSGDRP